MGLSKLSAKCRKCPFVSKCDNKRMEAYGYLEMPNLAAATGESSAASMVQPILRENTTIIVNGKQTVVYRDEIEKQLYDHLYRGLGLQYGG